MKRALYQLIRDYDNDMIAVVPIGGGAPISLMAAIEAISPKWVGIASDEGEDLRVAQVVIEIREHKSSLERA